MANVPRHGDGVRFGGFVENNQMLPVFTHHQKTVVVDAEMTGSDKRRLVGFIGGVDLTDGRFDTPEFPLFRYQETHGCEGEDFYQARRIRRREKQFQSIVSFD